MREYTDRISGTKSRRPGLDELLHDARRGRFDVLLIWAFDRIGRSTRHFLEVLDELNRLNVEFISFRENIDTSGPLGRALVVIIGAIAELERNLIIERVRAGMRLLHRADLLTHETGHTVEVGQALATGLGPGGLEQGLQLKKLKGGPYALDLLMDLGAAELLAPFPGSQSEDRSLRIGIYSFLLRRFSEV